MNGGSFEWCSGNGSAAGSSKRYRNPEYICRMSDSIHHYYLTTTWKGNRGTGTSDVGAYDRLHTVEVRKTGAYAHDR